MTLINYKKKKKPANDRWFYQIKKLKNLKDVLEELGGKKKMELQRQQRKTKTTRSDLFEQKKSIELNKTAVNSKMASLCGRLVFETVCSHSQKDSNRDIF